jgi:hypothetical protein
VEGAHYTDCTDERPDHSARLSRRHTRNLVRALLDRDRRGLEEDRVVVGPDRDRIDAGAGNDTIDSNDTGRETVSCGTGRRNRATADRSDD